MMHKLDTYLNNITMYRLVLYGLSCLAVYALCASVLGFLSFPILSLVTSLVLSLVVCYASNWLFAKIFSAAVNTESQFITAFILFFIIAPPETAVEYGIVVVASIVATAAKYLCAIERKHIANPVAVALLALMLAGRGEGIWWIGSMVMLPVVFVLAVLVIRKLRRYALVSAFGFAALLSTLYVGWRNEFTLDVLLTTVLVSGPFFFFMGIMLTEPLTTPPSRKLQILYGGIVGLLFGSQFSFGPVYSTPELALFVGNIFSYLVSPKYKLQLVLKEKRQLAVNLYEFIFSTPKKMKFAPGQYLEWTLPHAKADQRGMRRYFTIASAPHEDDIRVAARIEEGRSSSFKAALRGLEPGDSLVVSSLAGDFTLPKDTEHKLAFIAGGIGVTPFRSMVADLIARNEKRDIVFFFANRTEDEVAYQELFDAAASVGIKMVYVVTGSQSVDWKGYTGFLTKDIITKEAPDFAERTFYISGSHGMVTSFQKILAESGVPKSKIRTDYFPGFA